MFASVPVPEIVIELSADPANPPIFVKSAKTLPPAPVKARPSGALCDWIAKSGRTVACTFCAFCGRTRVSTFWPQYAQGQP